MKYSTVLSLILSYAIILIPGCKQRTDEVSQTKSSKTVQSSIDYDSWFSGFSMAAKKNKSGVGELVNEDVRGVFTETVVDNEIKVFAIDPNDLSTKVLLKSPNHFQPSENDPKKLFFQSPERPENYFTVEVMDSKTNVNKSKIKNAKLLVRVYSDVYGKGSLELIDGDASQLQLNGNDDDQMKTQLRSMMNDFAPLNSKYVVKNKGLNLADDEKGLSTYDKFRMFFGILIFGAATAGYAFLMLGADLKSTLPFLFIIGIVMFVLVWVGRALTKAMKMRMDKITEQMESL